MISTSLDPGSTLALPQLHVISPSYSFRHANATRPYMSPVHNNLASKSSLYVDEVSHQKVDENNPHVLYNKVLLYKFTYATGGQERICSCMSPIQL